MTRYSLAFGALLVALLAILVWQAALKLSNPDMTEARFFIEYWHTFALQFVVSFALGGVAMLWREAEEGER